MPTYDYQCDACDHQFELFQSITENPKKKCPQCGKSKLRRLIGPGAAIIFKGSGFYCTDYRGKSYHEKAAAEKKAAGGGESKPEGAKTDGAKSEASKPAAAKPDGKKKEKAST